MRNGQCPKCHSATVYSKSDGIYFYSPTRFSVDTGSFERAPYVAFICTSCGYFENYVADQHKLDEVAKTWPKVPVQTAR